MPIQPTVTSLLSDSKQAHAAYRDAAKTKNYPVCEQHVASALTARLAAQALDPSFDDPQWAADAPKWPHVKLVRFYQTYQVLP